MKFSTLYTLMIGAAIAIVSLRMPGCVSEEQVAATRAAAVQRQADAAAQATDSTAAADAARKAADEATAAKTQLTSDLAAAKAELAAARQSRDDLAGQLQVFQEGSAERAAAQARLDQFDKAIAVVTARVTQISDSSASLDTKVIAANTAATQAQSVASTAAAKASQIAVNIAAADKTVTDDSVSNSLVGILAKLVPGMGAAAAVGLPLLGKALNLWEANKKLAADLADSNDATGVIVNSIDFLKKVEPTVADAFAKHGDVLSAFQGAAVKAVIDSHQTAATSAAAA